ncbi:MAG TPA: glycosyl transferase [Prolixibacteraceae bacterium]|jgi:hypothetical protein|nr:glycosyl transferase [Prolixibacteraceae bacterium]
MNLDWRQLIANYWILLVFVALKLVLQFVLVNPIYELHRDEFLHLDQANHLAFGYISVPPLTALFSKMIYLLGGDLFWVRFFPALFGSLTVVFTWLIVEQIGGSLWSKFLVSCALVFSVLVRINILFQPNSFDILSWTMIFYLLIRYIHTSQPKWLYWLAIIVALGLSNKYNLIFLLIGLLVGIVFTQQRKLLSISTLYKALLLAFILILPNLIWQFDHGLPVIQHMKALKLNQLDHNSSIGFLKGQIMFFFGSLPISIAALWAFIFYKPFKPYRLIGICFVFSMALFSYLKAKDYYAIGLYPALFAFGAVFIEKALLGKWKLVVISSLIVVNLCLFVLVSKLVFPVLTPLEISQNKDAFERVGVLRWEDGKNHTLPQDFADMLGWREMADISLKAYRMIPVHELENSLIFCDNYGQTGALNYYNRGKMPEAYSFNTDYIYWLPNIKEIKNILLVGHKPSQHVLDMFSGCQLVGVVENEFAREKNTEIYLLTGGNNQVTETFYKMAEDRKNRLDIF